MNEELIAMVLPRSGLADPKDVAAYLGKPEKTLTNWRYLGTGPRYIKVGRNVRYRWTDIDRWVESQASVISGSGAG